MIPDEMLLLLSANEYFISPFMVLPSGSISLLLDVCSSLLGCVGVSSLQALE